MQGNVYHLAVERIARLQAELERLEAFVKTYEALATVAAQKAQASDDKGNSEVTNDVGGPEAAANVRHDDVRQIPTPRHEFERVVLEILYAHGAPLQRAALLHRIRARGVVIGGRNEMTNLGSKLSRTEGLVNLPGFGYWPKDRPFVPGGYSPGGTVVRSAA